MELMTGYTRLEVLVKMKDTGIVPLFYDDDLDLCKEIIRATYKGGARVFEFTNRGKYAYEHFKELIRFRDKELPEMALGAGTIVDAPAGVLFIQSGADFIVSPMLNEDLMKSCNRRKVLCMPGCATLTEITTAEELGAEVVKIFPAEQLGPSFVAALKAPFPWTSVMPSGGVSLSEESLSSWFNAGVFCVGMGSKLISKEIIKRNDFQLLENNMKRGIEMIRSLKK